LPTNGCCPLFASTVRSIRSGSNGAERRGERAGRSIRKSTSKTDEAQSFEEEGGGGASSSSSSGNTSSTDSDEIRSLHGNVAASASSKIRSSCARRRLTSSSTLRDGMEGADES